MDRSSSFSRLACCSDWWTSLDVVFRAAAIRPIRSSTSALVARSPCCSATAFSTNNDADYELSASPAVFTNNAGQSFTLVSATGVPEILPSSLVMGEPRVAPNPFTTSTRVQMQLARAAQAKLVVIDAAGRRIGEIARSLPAGAASIEWDGRSANGTALPSGVYFYRLEVEGTTKTGQFLLLR